MFLDIRIIDQLLDSQKSRIYLSAFTLASFALLYFLRKPLLRGIELVAQFNSSVLAWVFLVISILSFCLTTEPVQDWIREKTTSKYQELLVRLGRFTVASNIHELSIKDGNLFADPDPLSLNAFFRSMHSENQTNFEKAEYDEEQYPNILSSLRVIKFSLDEKDPLVQYTNHNPTIIVGLCIPPEQSDEEICFIEYLENQTYYSFGSLHAVRYPHENAEGEFLVECRIYTQRGTRQLIYLLDESKDQFQRIESEKWKEEAHREISQGDTHLKNNPIELPAFKAESEFIGFEDDDLPRGPRFIAHLKLEAGILHFDKATDPKTGEIVKKPERIV